MGRVNNTGTLNGQRVKVVGGWDPPLHTAFLDVTVVGEEDPVFDSMMSHFGKSLSVAQLRQMAADLRLEVPAEFWSDVQSDCLRYVV